MTPTRPVARATRERSRIRYSILAIIFLITTVNYADRATLSIAGTDVAKTFGLDAADMGIIFSAFGWTYLAMQLPGGWFLDRFGSKRVYTWSLFFWSLFTFVQGFVGSMPIAWAATSFFIARLLLGLAEAPSFPANSRIVSSWFPANERGTATAIYSAGQYAALAAFSPLLGWLTYTWGWEHVFWVMGGLGFVLTAVWVKWVQPPAQHPRISQRELDTLIDGGALIDIDQPRANAEGPKWRYIGQMLRSRMLVGVFLGQYFFTTITWFFLTWFPIYLVHDKGLSILKVGLLASIPAICGCVGGVLGGLFSDALLRRGHSLTVARKTPIIAGMLLSTSLILCNYTNTTWIVITLMSLAMFGKGFANLGWSVVTDTAPKQVAGLCGGVFNSFGNMASIVTPLVIGFLVNTLHSFNAALVFVGASAVAAIGCYLFVVGDIKRFELR